MIDSRRNGQNEQNLLCECHKNNQHTIQPSTSDVRYKAVIDNEFAQ